jgi:ribonuclease T2
MRRMIAVATALAAIPAAHAQVEQCTAPRVMPPVRAEGPTGKEPRRVIPTGSYTLALTWSPEHCAESRGGGEAFQCDGKSGRFGFVLHGLWPDGTGKTWPQYCRTSGVLPPTVIRANMCVTPDAQLIQHEWAKHGTCVTTRPAAYFDRSRRMYQKLRFPDMAALARRDGLTAGDLADAMAVANPGLGATMMRVTATRDGWLDEIWMCLNKRFTAEACKPGSGGVQPGAPVKIRMP